jgi:hypothetical protein
MVKGEVLMLMTTCHFEKNKGETKLRKKKENKRNVEDGIRELCGRKSAT